jgi:DNA-binding response OmpR family regulator
VQRVLGRRPALEVLAAGTGTEGLELARTRRPAAVLLDLDLPDLHGGEVLRRLRADAATAPIPIIVLSAHATAPEIRELIDAGARAYLTKPLNIAELVTVVECAIAEDLAA